MTTLESDGQVSVHDVTLTVCEGTVKAMTSRAQTRTVSSGQTKTVSRPSLNPLTKNVVTEVRNEPTTINETIRDFWVVSDDSSEKHVETRASVDVRDGHVVRLYLYGESPAIVVNTNIRQWWVLPEVADPLLSKFGSWGEVSWKLLFGSAFGALLFLSLTSDTAGWLALVFWALTAICVFVGPVRFFLYRRALRKFKRFLQGVSAMLN